MDKIIQERLRALPGVDVLLGLLEERLAGYPAGVVKKAARQVIDRTRKAIAEEGEVCPPAESLAQEAIREAGRLYRPKFRRVINGTGVVIHTNLGRSPLSGEVAESIARLTRTYSNLEFDLEQGRRGSRYQLVEEILRDLTGAEAALVVNNNAAAVFLSLNSLAQGREVAVSRGQLVEIGGSFRIPDVMDRSGAIMVEVGTTNKTHLRDYEQAINENTAGILKVHQSNFAMVGFSQQVPLEEMSALARAKGIWSMEDLGSGCLLDLSDRGLPREPTVAEAMAKGADVLTFSGDKLLGGPQAGIILGRAELIGRIKSNPINRAVRIDKMTLAGLEAVLRLYLEPDKAVEAIPVLKMMTLPQASLADRASRLKRAILKALAGEEGATAKVSLVKGYSQVGGGSMPLAVLPTRLVGIEIPGLSAAALGSRLREREIPIVGRIEKDLFMLDPRTLLSGDSGEIASAVRNLAGETARK